MPDWPLLLLEAVALAAASIAVGVVAHEFGHAAVARMVGFEPRVIQIGDGPVILKLKVAAVRLVWRLWPLSGSVTCLPRPAGQVAATVIYLLGGMLANAGVLGVAAAVSIGSSEIVVWAHTLGLAQVLMITMSAVPWSHTKGGRHHASDMLKIVRLLRRPDHDAVAEGHGILLRRLLTPGVPLLPPSADAPEIVFQCGRSDWTKERWARDDMLDAMDPVLARDVATVQERALVLNTLVRVELVGGTNMFLEELDAWSAEAMSLVDTPLTRLTRVGALLRLDRPAEARAVLGTVQDADLPPEQETLRRAYLSHADAELRLRESIADMEWKGAGIPSPR